MQSEYHNDEYKVKNLGKYLEITYINNKIVCNKKEKSFEMISESTDKKFFNNHNIFWLACSFGKYSCYEFIDEYLNHPTNICITTPYQEKNIINILNFYHNTDISNFNHELSPLQLACVNNMCDVVDTLINSTVVDINYYCKGYNALQYMIIENKFDKDIFELLINNGINVLQDYENIKNKNIIKHFLHDVDIDDERYRNNIECFDKLLKYMLYSCLINDIIDEYVFNGENIYDLIKNLNKSYIIDDFIDEFKNNLVFVKINTLLIFYSTFERVDKIFNINIKYLNSKYYDSVKKNYNQNNNYINTCIDYFLSPKFNKNTNKNIANHLHKIFNTFDIELIIKNDDDHSFLSSLSSQKNKLLNHDIYKLIVNKYIEIKKICDDKKLEECKICFDSNVSKCKLLPCNHDILCIDCIHKINNVCPYCRSKIISYIEYSNVPIIHHKNNVINNDSYYNNNDDDYDDDDEWR